jgi:hypothetical protein
MIFTIVRRDGGGLKKRKRNESTQKLKSYNVGSGQVHEIILANLYNVLVLIFIVLMKRKLKKQLLNITTINWQI